MKTNEIKTNVIDNRIVRLNAIIGTKLSSVSKNKREQLKADRCLAKYVVENFDLEDILIPILNDREIGESEVFDIIADRVEELKKKRLVAAKASKKTKTNNSTSKTKEAVSKAGRPVSHKVGDRHPEHDRWVWTEYKPGKFDWRTDEKMKMKAGRHAST